MGLIGNVQKIETEQQGDTIVNNVTIDPGPGSNLTAEQFSPAGDDSKPLVGDWTIGVESTGTGNFVSVGFIDPKNGSQVEPGEKRLYSRDSDGNVAASVYLKNDGSIEVKNENGSINLAADGVINLNGVVIDTDGNISTNGSVGAKGVTDTTNNVTLSTHIHPTPNGPSSPPTAGT